ncbi:MAG: hypothetical protein WCK28_20360 [Burkholderiales bacterium]
MSRSTVARGIAAALLLLAAAGLAGGALVDATLPLLRQGFSALAPEFGLRALARREGGQDGSLVAEVVLARPVTVAGRRYEPDPRGAAWAETPAGHVLLMPAVVVLLVLVVPAAGPREAVVRAGFASAALLPAMAVDVPAVLAANVWALFPGGSARDGAIGAWATFMSGGGRLALGVLVGAAAIAAGRYIAAGRRTGVGRPAGAGARTPAPPRPAGRPSPSAPRSATRGSRASARTRR